MLVRSVAVGATLCTITIVWRTVSSGHDRPAAMSPRRPNILLVMADQLGASFLPSYGHRVVRAPALTRLAERGVQFDAAYTNSPLCAPSRFTMLAGLRNSRIGAYDNASELPASVPTFAHHLRAGGYQTCLAGKMHFVGPDQLHGFEERLTTDIYPADFGWTPDWSDPDGRFDWWFHNMDSVRFAGVAEASNQLDYDDEVGFQAVRKIRDLARTADARPWMLTVSFTHPHDPYVQRREYWDRYDHDTVEGPRVGPLPLDSLDPHSRRLRHVSAMDDDVITEAQIRNARHAYYASISYVDEWLGRILATLEACALADDTVVIFTADHGDMLGERGLWYKMNFFEHACRVPLLVAGPGIDARRVAEPVSHLDVLPTLCELAGLPVPAAADGTSLAALLGGDRQSDRRVLGEYLGEGAIAPILMVREHQEKYVHCDADPPQLYDLSADPDELRNLAAEPSSSATIARFDAIVHATWDPAAWFARKEQYVRIYGTRLSFIPPDAQNAIVLQPFNGDGSPRNADEFAAHCRDVSKFLRRRVIQASTAFLDDVSSLRRPVAEILTNLDAIATVFPVRDDPRPIMPRDLPTDRASLSGIDLAFEFWHDGGALPDLEGWRAIASHRVRRVTASFRNEGVGDDSTASIVDAKAAGIAVSVVLPHGPGDRERPMALVDLVDAMPLGRGDSVYLMEVQGEDAPSQVEVQRQRESLKSRLAPTRERGAKIADYNPAKQWS